MRLAKTAAVVFVATLLAWSEASAMDFLDAEAEGWHKWQVDLAGPDYVQYFVLMENGEVSKIRVSGSECGISRRVTAADHGVLSAAESFEWFRSLVEDEQVDDDIREAALFGLVQTESDAAYEYIDQLLSRN